MGIVSEILEKSAREAEKYKGIEVDKHVELDVGDMLVFDGNPLDQGMFR